MNKIGEEVSVLQNFKKGGIVRHVRSINEKMDEKIEQHVPNKFRFRLGRSAENFFYQITEEDE